MEAVGERTILKPYGFQNGSCGYCKDPETSERTPNSRFAYFAAAEQLKAEDYQRLINRGWRRSGDTLYKPDQKHSCCPHYTIRLPVVDFKTSKSQRQALHRWNRFVLGDEYQTKVAKIHPQSRQEKRRTRNEFDFEETIHEAEASHVKRPPEPEHAFSVELDSNDFTEEKYAVFENYQRTVHKEDPSKTSRKSFKRFLCTSPIATDFVEDDRGRRKTGSFHQCYRLDGRLFAIGVIDLLPDVVSAVYFIYHSDFEDWSMGKLSALRETALTKELGYKYYNMGFYIHSCKKMRYKAEFKPQYVLDPESYTWDAMDDKMMKMLDDANYVSVSAARRNATGYSNPTEDKHDEIETLMNNVERRSLFDLHMAGVLSPEDLKDQVDLDNIKALFSSSQEHFLVPCSATRSWKDNEPTDVGSLKGIIAELAACTGPVVANEMIVSFA